MLPSNVAVNIGHIMYTKYNKDNNSSARDIQTTYARGSQTSSDHESVSISVIFSQ